MMSGPDRNQQAPSDSKRRYVWPLIVGAAFLLLMLWMGIVAARNTNHNPYVGLPQNNHAGH